MAPTQKISDDASFPQRPPSAGQVAQATPPPSAAPRAMPQAPYAQSAPIVTQPGVTPPRMTPPPRPTSAPPAGFAAPSVVPHAPNGAAKPDHRPRTAPIDEPSLSLPIAARRPWSLILVVLAIDIGLAVAGGWMLSQGLGSRPGAAGAATKSDPPSAGSQ